jgi:hypothetical protein
MRKIVYERLLRICIRSSSVNNFALWEWNDYVDTFNISFEPVVGKTYYLYEGTTKFVSILNPLEFKRKCVGFTKLCSDGYWIRLEE